MPDKELERLCEKWEKQYRYGTVEQRKERAKLWEPYYSSIYKKQLGCPYSHRDHKSGTVEQLVSAGILNRETTVLDIGCGLGAYSLEMSQYCKSVLALDSNRIAIDVLKDRCAQNKVNSIEALSIAWEDYLPQRKFNLVFSSMCPAICNLQELLKMEVFCSGYCVLLTVMNGSYEKCRKKMMQELGIVPEGMITEYGVYLSVLEQLGREVSAYKESFQSGRILTADDLIEQYVPYLRIFGIEDDRARSYLMDFFERNQEDGKLYDESKINTALLYWKAE
jgi:SAM-dependent methyltransferase